MHFQDHRASTRGPVRKTLEHRTISSAVADNLRQRILGGELESGFQLRQDYLAAEFGVSRIPVREALMQLEAEGLVKLSPHRGATVSSPTIEEIQEVFELRGMLEPTLLMASAPRLTSEDFVMLEVLLDEYASNMEANNVRIWGELNTNLHMLLYSRAQRPRSEAIVLSLLRESDRHTRIQLTIPGAILRARDEHAELVALCRKGRFAQARDLMEDHVKHSGASLRDFLRSRSASQR
jgi:DNA-binding GntR family transcriptional regulator